MISNELVAVKFRHFLHKIGESFDLRADTPHPVVSRRLRSIRHVGFTGRDAILAREISFAVDANTLLSHDPEVGFCAHVLGMDQCSSAIRRDFLRLLAVHVGCRDIDSLRYSPFRVARRLLPLSIIFQRQRLRDRFTAIPVCGSEGFGTQGHHGVLILPVQARQYAEMKLEGVWDGSHRIPTNVDLRNDEDSLVCLLGAAGDSVHCRFSGLIKMLLVAREISGGVRHSFNLRLAYPGVIFVDPADRTKLLVAEDILHEFVHQQLWLASELSGTVATPGDWKVEVMSPFTNRPRPLPVMAQAAIIYAAIGLFLESQSSGKHWNASCSRRLEAIISKLPLLLTQLRQTAYKCEPIRQLLDVVESQYAH